MKIISILTQKGGVGKTTSAIHLGASIASKNRKTKVLLIDLDTQCNLSQGCKVEEDFPYTIKNFLEMSGDFRLKHQGANNLYILSGDKNLESLKLNRYALKERLKDLEKYLNFDYVIIDCPPRPLLEDKLTLGEVALCASDYVLSVLKTDEYSIKGVNDLVPSILRIKELYNTNLKYLGLFFNEVEINTRDFRIYYDLIKQSEASDFLIKSFIRKDVKIKDAVKEGKTIFQLSPKSRASEDFKKLSKEILKKIENE